MELRRSPDICLHIFLSQEMRACTVLIFLSCTAFVSALQNGLGKLPGIGWNSDYCLNCISEGESYDFNRLGGYQNEDYIKHYIADFLVSSGLSKLGYVYVNMDAGWDLFNRSSAGDLVPDPTQWPNGISSTISYVHGLGLKFGLYGDRGTSDCSKRPGQLGYETQDADLFAKLEIDWFKSDSCYASQDHATAFAEYGTMRDALNATGRPIWFALCGWNPWYAPVGQSLGNSWRIGPDTGSGWTNVMTNVDNMLTIAEFAGSTSNGGGWNDMSLLLLPGMGSGANLITPARHRSQFSLHCVFAANMLMTGNLSSLDPFALETWGNPEAVAVNQDPAGLPFVVLTPESNSDDSNYGAYVPVSVAECGGEPTYQNWTYGSPATEFLFNSASDQCLNVEACGTTIIFDGCTTTGGTCAGPGKFSNEQWSFPGDGSWRSLLPGENCATLQADNTVILAPCNTPLSSNQIWFYLSSSGQLQTGSGLCVTAPQGPPSPNVTETLLIGRPLHDGSWALLALNNKPTNATITCGPACFSAIGFPSTTVLTVRDLWLHENINTTTATSLDIQVGANGSSTFLKLIPSTE
jgi:Alpha galactosidase A/Alpha galactosidase C-terminal beta sandwich domain